jgi:hypothetical protein
MSLALVRHRGQLPVTSYRKLRIACQNARSTSPNSAGIFALLTGEDVPRATVSVGQQRVISSSNRTAKYKEEDVGVAFRWCREGGSNPHDPKVGGF